VKPAPADSAVSFDPAALSDYDLNALIGRAIGASAEITYVASADGGETIVMHTHDTITRSTVEAFCSRHPQYKCLSMEWWPRYSTSIADAWAMEAAIPEEKRDEYCKRLWVVLNGTPVEWRSKFCGYWYMVHATPRQRCLAAYAALSGGVR
jgi:hypothetical protein